MQNCLPHNLVCLDLLDGPFCLEHPREMVYLAHISQPPRKSFKPSVDVLPLVQWFPSLPSVQRTPSLPPLPLAQSHPGDPGDPCSPGERPSMRWFAVNVQILQTFVLVVWHFKYLQGVYLTSNRSRIKVTDLIVQHHSWEQFKLFQKRANWQTSKNERCILVPSRVNWQTFSPGFPLSPIKPGLPSWPW